jgi:GDP/UDP-N,N'-diacetylbacillosamine 2-epimerase (hydrolysing)
MGYRYREKSRQIFPQGHFDRNMTTKICAVTGSRAEFGVIQQTLEKIREASQLELQLVVTGMHLAREFGYTIDEITGCGFEPSETVEMMLASDTNVGMGKSIGLGIISFTDCFTRLAPDLILVIGDRFETFAAVVTAMALNIPIAHISGGEITEGAIDEQMRHAITKISHIHFTALPENANIVKQMGEEPWRVHAVGGPWVDNLNNLAPFSQAELSNIVGLDLTIPTILVTYHPVTLQLNKTGEQIGELLKALAQFDFQIIFTYPNADAGGRIIIKAVKDFIATRKNAVMHQSLGNKVYLNLLQHICLMAGNSSSGMVESQAFKLPVINIGERQKGRKVTNNIINTPVEQASIAKAIGRALSPEFKKMIAIMKNPYDEGGVAENIVNVLSNLPARNTLLNKKFRLQEK